MAHGKAPSQREEERHDDESAVAIYTRWNGSDVHLSGGLVFVVPEGRRPVRLMNDPSASGTGKYFNDGTGIEPQEVSSDRRRGV